MGRPCTQGDQKTTRRDPSRARKSTEEAAAAATDLGRFFSCHCVQRGLGRIGKDREGGLDTTFL